MGGAFSAGKKSLAGILKMTRFIEFNQEKNESGSGLSNPELGFKEELVKVQEMR